MFQRAARVWRIRVSPLVGPGSETLYWEQPLASNRITKQELKNVVFGHLLVVPTTPVCLPTYYLSYLRTYLSKVGTSYLGGTYPTTSNCSGSRLP